MIHQLNKLKYLKMTQIKLTFDIKTLPSEVITLICSFGYPEYKEYMKEICHEITNYTGTGLLAYNLHFLHEEYLHLYRMNYIQCMQEFLTYAVDENILKDLFKQCTKCCCCSKHGHNRPTNYYTDDISIGESFNTSETCHCTCRSISRNIKRVQESYSYLQFETDKKSKICRRESTFNIQFIPQSTRTLHHHAQFDRVNPQSLP